MDNFLIQAQLISEIISHENIAEIKKSYKEISLKYRNENIQSQAVVSSDVQALSYLASRMGETSVVVYSVLEKLNNLISLDNQVKSVLDLGSGTGSVLWALKNFLFSADIVAVEKQESMIKYSKLLSKYLEYNINYINEDVLSSKVENLTLFDLVIESFMLNEMSGNDRKQTLDLMMSKTNKFIVLIEPGTPNSYTKMMEDRDYLLSKGFCLVLPCPHGCKCGLVDDYCNFTVRVDRTKISRYIKDSQLGYEDEKFFYLIFSKDVIENGCSTILRKPVFAKNRVELKLCNKDGSVCKTVVTKNNKQQYSQAKKLKHGDSFVIN